MLTLPNPESIRVCFHLLPPQYPRNPSTMASLVLNIGSSNRVSVNDECISKFNDLKLGKSLKYIIYKLSDDYKEVVVEEASTDPDWENFQNKLLNAKSAWKGKEGKGPRYAVYDFQYELEGGEGLR